MLFCHNLYTQDDTKHKNTGFLDFNGYYDTREFSTLTINALANLPHRFQYFSLTNFDGSDNTSDLNRYYTEQNIRWNAKENSPLDITLQWVSRTGSYNDDLRLGIRWRLNDTNKLNTYFKKVKLSYSVSLYYLQFTTKSQSKLFTQLEHVYNLNLFPSIFKNRLYFGGFADQNINYLNNGKISFNWVTEHQLGYNIIDALYLVLEYRINDFLPSDNFGFGYGLEYKIKF